MNTTQNTSPQAATSRFGSLRNLGRGIAVSSAVALLGVSTMSAADASAAARSAPLRSIIAVLGMLPVASSPLLAW